MTYSNSLQSTRPDTTRGDLLRAGSNRRPTSLPSGSTKPPVKPRRRPALRGLLGLAACAVLLGLVASPLARADALGDALDAPSLTWTTGGDAPWYAQTTNTHDGVDAAQSGAVISSYSQSWLQTTVTGRVTVVFSWKFTTANPNYFAFSFYTNGYNNVGTFSTVDWRQQAVSFAGGTNTLLWGSYNLGTNLATGPGGVAWLDQVTVTNITGLKPTFLTQPAPLVVVPELYPFGTNLSAAVVGDIPLSYQWQRSETNLSQADYYYGANTPTLSFAAQTPAANGEYRLVASNVWGMATSAVCTVSVVPAKPFLLPDGLPDFLIAPGTYLQLGGYAFGTPPFGYQWFKDAAAILSATNRDHTINWPLLGDTGGYSVVVTNLYGAATSRVAQVTVSTALPSIVTGPNPEVSELLPGDYASFSVEAAGPEYLSYSWRRVGDTAELASWTSLSLSGVDPTNSGLYQVIVANNNGAVTSRVSVLAVTPVTALGLALDAPQLTVTNDFGWNHWIVDVTGTNAHDGLCAARSPGIGDADSAPFSTVVTGPTNVSFWWRISAGAQAYLDIAVDGVVSNTISGETPWQKQSLGLPAGEHTLTWNFRKLNAGSVGADAAWVDQFTFGGDNNGNGVLITNFTTGGGADWYLQATNTHASGDAWQSGVIYTTQQTWLRAPVTGPGTLSFWWMVSSSGVNDPLEFYVDGALQTNIDGEVSWQQVSLPLGSGEHQLEWRYSNAASVSGGMDAGWVAEVMFSPAGGGVTNPPVIVSLDYPSVVWEYSPVTFSVVATGSLPLFYQWFFEGGAIPYATNSSYSIPSASRWEQGNYRVEVSNSAGTDYREVYLEILMVPLVGYISPGSLSVPAGSNAVFFASVSGTRPIRFQWYRGAVLVPGATNQTLTLSNLTSADAGSYRLAATNAYGGILSGETAQLTVLTRPVFTSVPANLSRVVGQSATFSATVTGAPPLFYQWRKGASDIPGANGTSYTIPSVTTNDEGSYSIVITNSFGSTNRSASLLVYAPPFIAQQPSNQAALAGGSLWLQVTAGGTPALTYQWRRFGTNVPLATSTSFRIAPCSTNDAGPYTVVVSNTYGAVTSVVAWVSVKPPPPGYAPSALDPGFATSLGADNAVNAALALPDGRWLIGGAFTTVHGASRMGVARLNADGTLDPTFTSPLSLLGRVVYAIAVQSDGRIVIGGYLNPANGGANLVRLNTDGSLDTNFVAIVAGVVTGVGIGPGEKIVVCGGFVTVNGVARRELARLNSNGTLDTGFTPPTSFPTYVNSVTSVAVQPDGRVLYATVEGDMGSGTAHQSVFRLLDNGQPDNSFSHPLSVTAPGGVYVQLSEVYGLRLQPNGKILITAPYVVVRLFSNGSLDPSFATAVFDTRTRGGVTFALLGGDAVNDPQVFVGGSYETVNALNRNSLVLLGTNGVPLAGYTPGTAREEQVFALAADVNGRLLVGGRFTQLGGLPRVNFGFFNANGTFDATAYAGQGTLAPLYGVHAIAPMADGRIVIGGDFNNFNGTPVFRVARLLPDAGLDATFNAGSGPDGLVMAVALQPDGKILIGGMFSNVASQAHARLARLNPDGSVDSAFNPALTGPYVEVSALAVQTNGHILVAGSFTGVNGTVLSNLARLDPDGLLDPSFGIGTGANAGLTDLALRSDGRIYVAGDFQNIGGQAAPGMAVLQPDGTLLPIPGGYPSPRPHKLAIAPDGTVYVGTISSGVSTPTLWRLNLDGTRDVFLLASGIPYSARVDFLAVQPDGRPLVYSPDYMLRRFNPDRFEDPLFPAITLGGELHSLATLAGGHILAGGQTLAVPLYPGGPYVTRHGLAWLNGDTVLLNAARPVLRALPGWPPFILSLQGAPGATYDLEATENLQAWTHVLTTNLPPSGTIQVSDPAAGNYPHRFYRVIQQP